MEKPDHEVKQVQTNEPALADSVSEEQVKAFLSAALASRPGWRLRKREPIRSFQQYLERIEVDWEAGRGESSHRSLEEKRAVANVNETVFLRVYRGFMSWWTLATSD